MKQQVAEAEPRPLMRLFDACKLWVRETCKMRSLEPSVFWKKIVGDERIPSLRELCFYIFCRLAKWVRLLGLSSGLRALGHHVVP